MQREALDSLCLCIVLILIAKDTSVMLRVNSRFIGKSKRPEIGVSRIVEIDPVVSPDLLHGRLKRNGLRLQSTRRVRATREDADRLGGGVLPVGKNIDIRNRMRSQFVSWSRRGNIQLAERIGESGLTEFFQ